LDRLVESYIPEVVYRGAGVVTTETRLLSVDQDIGRIEVVGCDRASRSREEPLSEIVEFGLEGNLAIVVYRGIETEEVELVRGRGDRRQRGAVPPQDRLLVVGREIRCEGHLT
jgi:hypothetical protein